MGFDDASGYVQAETQAPVIILADLREALEDAPERIVGYAATGIPDAQTDVAGLPLATNRDLPASRRELQRIRDEIREHLKDPLMVERREKRRGIDPGLQGHPFCRGGCSKRIRRFGDQNGQIPRCRCDGELTGVYAGDIDQVADQPVHAGGVPLDALGFRDNAGAVLILRRSL
jgi:hypothetical protein